LKLLRKYGRLRCGILMLYNLVRAAGLEPAWGCPQRIFVPSTAFAQPKNGAGGRGRTGIPCETRFCAVRVCQFNHAHLNHAHHTPLFIASGTDVRQQKTKIKQSPGTRARRA
jgi:hypothetical protein